MKKLMIFDCDGVLREFSWNGIFLGYCRIAAYFDIPLINDCVTVEEFKKIYSHDWRKNLTQMGIISCDDVSTANAIFCKAYLSRVHMFDWVPREMSKITKERMICIFTNSSATSVAESLNGVMHHFEMNVGHELVEKLKPDPSGIYFIMENLGFDQKNTIMIGDSEADIVAGKSAGVSTALVTWGATTDEDEVKRLNADTVVRSPKDLLSINF